MPAPICHTCEYHNPETGKCRQLMPTAYTDCRTYWPIVPEQPCDTEDTDIPEYQRQKGEA